MADYTNFILPVKEIANSKVKLVPFNGSRHTALFINLGGGQPEMWAHMKVGPYASIEQFETEALNGYCRPDSTLLYAIIDMTKPADEGGSDGGAFAGIVSLLSTIPGLYTEIGGIVVLPAFQRTHVASNVVGLLVQHALKPLPEGGLGLVRVIWQASTANKGSAKLAERMGFRYEGTLRYDKCFKDGKLHGKIGCDIPAPPGSGENDLWRDTLTFGLCWDDWEKGAKEKVQTAMDRTK